MIYVFCCFFFVVKERCYIFFYSYFLLIINSSGVCELNLMELLCCYSPLSNFQNIQVGSRCEVAPGGKRGVVKFVGQAEPLGPGFWVGVQYDEPLGKHDGM
jgi:hypothetical protein